MNQLFVTLGIESWKPFLSVLLLPPVPLLLLVLIGTRLVLPRRGLGWAVVLTSVTLLWFSCTSAAGWWISQTLLRPPPAITADGIASLKAAVQAREPVAIVVLGGGARSRAPEYGMSNLSELSLERLRYGLWLSRETGAPVAFSGGIGWGARADSPAEAQVAARIAEREFGRPLKWTEEKSRDTRENASHSIALLREQGVRRIVLVTNQVHMPRALRAFEQAAHGGLKVEPAPLDIYASPFDEVQSWLPTRRGFERVHMALHEWFGLVFGA